jgi:hypothetical protein
LDNHFIVEPADPGRLRISLHLTMGDTAVTIVTAAAAEAADTSLRELQEDVLLQTQARLKRRLQELRAVGTDLL